MICLFLLPILVITVVDSSYSAKELRCLVCEKVIMEMEKEISKVSPNKKINLGHRINDDGKVVEKTKPYARSEMHLSELMDTICQKMDNYARATNKSSGKLALIPLMSDSGGMNKDIMDYELITDSDLNKSLKFYCEGIVEEFENEIFGILREETKFPSVKVCTEATYLCDKDEYENKSEL